MIHSFDYQLKTNIHFGCGKSREIGGLLQNFPAKNIMLVTDLVLCGLGLLDGITKSLIEAGATVYTFSDIEPNPRVSTVDKCRDFCLEKQCELIVAVGGGSVMDVAKGAAVLATNGGSIHDYLLGRREGVSEVTNTPLPLIAIPTTSGTGSEVSECIVIVDTNNIKDLMLSEQLAPSCALIDPELTYGVPPQLTAYTGLDVLSHALEGYTSLMENAFVDLLALEAIRLTFAWLPACVNSPTPEARSNMALASVLAGIVQSKCGCTIPHAVSCPLTVYHNIPHGLGVGVAQLAAIDFNRKECRTKYERILRLIDAKMAPGDDPADLLIAKIRSLFKEIAIPEKLDVGGITEEKLERFSKDAMEDDGVNVNPRPVTQDALKEMYPSFIC